MSKLLKYLGIGTAIGTLAYAVIKYKHDEKFKEKVDTVVDKVEEKTDKTVGKVFDFMADHPTLTTMGILAAVMTPAWIITAKGAKKRQDMYNQAYEEYLSSLGTEDEECRRINEIAKAEAQKQIEVEISRKSSDIFNNWKEDYRDKWDRVNDFAKSLDLVEGESFMIEEGSQYDCDGTIVSHLINGEGCYPPEMN